MWKLHIGFYGCKQSKYDDMRPVLKIASLNKSLCFLVFTDYLHLEFIFQEPTSVIFTQQKRDIMKLLKQTILLSCFLKLHPTNSYRIRMRAGTTRVISMIIIVRVKHLIKSFFYLLNHY